MRACQVLTSLLFLVCACVVEDSKVTLKCDLENPCPVGVTCTSEGVCSSGDMLDMTMQSGDASGDASDQPDLLQPGCAGQGGKKVGTAIACPGAFAEGQAASLCAAGYRLCRASDIPALDIAACNQLSGFFIFADVPGYYLIPNRDSPSCGTSTAGGSPVWYGCGSLSSALVKEHMASKCSGLGRSVDCSQSGGLWFCRVGGDLSKTTNKSASDGALCCK